VTNSGINWQCKNPYFFFLFSPGTGNSPANEVVTAHMGFLSYPKNAPVPMLTS
jgi:hypothetical protein